MRKDFKPSIPGTGTLHLRRSEFRRVAVFLLLALFPFLLTAVHSACCRQNLFLGIPRNSDEFCYWRVLHSVSECGFDFASTCGILGREAPVGPLGEHGLSTLFAWAGVLPFGVGDHTLFLWNLAVLSLALALFALLAKPGVRTALWALLLVIGNGVVLEQWYSHMMELPCMAVVIAFFALSRAWERTGRRAFLLLALAVCVYASFMRICYAVLAFPLVLSLCLRPAQRPTLWPFLAYLAAFAALRQSTALFMKGSDSFLTGLAGAGLRAKISLLAANFSSNFAAYFSFSNGSPVEVGQRWFQVALFAVLLAAAFLARRRGKPADALAFLSHALALAALAAMLMLLYTVSDWRDVRTTMPYALGLSLWFVAKTSSTASALSRRTALALRGALLAAATASLFVFAPAKFRSNHPADRFAAPSVDDAWMADIPDEKATFCLFDARLDSPRLFALFKKLPPRVGILFAPKSRTLLEAVPKPDFVLSARDMDLPDLALWKTTADFGKLYRARPPAKPGAPEPEN